MIVWLRVELWIDLRPRLLLAMQLVCILLIASNKFVRGLYIDVQVTSSMCVRRAVDVR